MIERQIQKRQTWAREAVISKAALPEVPRGQEFRQQFGDEEPVIVMVDRVEDLGETWRLHFVLPDRAAPNPGSAESAAVLASEAILQRTIERAHQEHQRRLEKIRGRALIEGSYAKQSISSANGQFRHRVALTMQSLGASAKEIADVLSVDVAHVGKMLARAAATNLQPLSEAEVLTARTRKAAALFPVSDTFPRLSHVYRIPGIGRKTALEFAVWFCMQRAAQRPSAAAT